METTKKKESTEKTQFLAKNLGRGLAWLAIIIVGYLLARKHFDFDIAEIMGPLYNMPMLIFSIFLVSEVVLGIIPPEFFMIWSARHEDIGLYVQNVAVFTAMSYMAGIIGYFIGSRFNSTQLYACMKKNFLGKTEKQFNRFGGFLVIVAALTPLPFSAICMLTGAVKYPFKKFLIIALSRLIRFTLYAYIIWETHVI